MKQASQNYSETEKVRIEARLPEPWKGLYGKIWRGKFLKEEGKYLKVTEGAERDLSSKALKVLEDALGTVPPFQVRVYSMKGIHKTNALTSPEINMPDAHRHYIPTVAHPSEMSLKDGANMLCCHLRWRNYCEDCYLSYTISPIFYIAHATGRIEQLQGPLYLAFGRIDRLEKRDGSKPFMANANTLLDVFPASESKKMSARDVLFLQPRQFAHETLTFGETRDPHGAFCHVEIGVLIKNGLLALIPEIILPDMAARAKVYGLTGGMKKETFYDAKPTPMSYGVIIIAFHSAGIAKPRMTSKPALDTFIRLLCYRKRPAKNPKFRSKVKLEYTAADVQECIYPDMHKIPKNQVDTMQYYKLLQEAAAALNMPLVLPALEVIETHGRFTFCEDSLPHMIEAKHNKYKQKIVDDGCWELTPEHEAARKLLAQKYVNDRIPNSDNNEYADVADVREPLARVDSVVGHVDVVEDEEAVADKDAEDAEDAEVDEDAEDAEVDEEVEGMLEDQGMADGIMEHAGGETAEDEVNAEDEVEHAAEAAEDATAERKRKAVLGEVIGRKKARKEPKEPKTKLEKWQDYLRRLAGQLRRAKQSREEQREWHATFKDDNEPTLRALLPPGETWD